jgi:hypothetical protein
VRRTSALGQYLLRSLPPVGRHLETLPDVHCELQRVAGGRMSQAHGDALQRLVPRLRGSGRDCPVRTGFDVGLVVSRARGASNGPAEDHWRFGSCGLRWRLRPDMGPPGADAADLDREKFECQFEASKTVASAGTEGAVAETKRNELESLCMEARGWSRSWGR